MAQRASFIPAPVLDLWALAEEDSSKIVASSSDSSSTTMIENETNEDENNVVLFIGDSSCGKSSLIQGFLKPNATFKDPKPTVALEYNFARKKTTGTGKNSSGNGKIVAHIWELGGDNIHEPKLLELPLSTKLIKSSSVVICVDLIKPAQILTSLTLWIKNINDIIIKRLGKSLSGPSIPAATRNPGYKDHVDEARVNPCDIPLYIFANKFDVYKSMQQGDKRLILQILRFIAHYYGATLIATSSVEPSMKEGFRNILSAINFRSNVAGSGNTGIKVSCETSIDRPFHITAGQDSFENILLGSKSERDSGGNVPKSKLALTEQDLSLYIGSAGLTKDCWNRLSEHLKSVFGEAEVLKAVDNDDDTGHIISNEYPEPDIDAMRTQRDLILERYIQEKERKEATLQKMNATATSSKSEGVGPGGNTTEMDDQLYEERGSKPSSKSSRK